MNGKMFVAATTLLAAMGTAAHALAAPTLTCDHQVDPSQCSATGLTPNNVQINASYYYSWCTDHTICGAIGTGTAGWSDSSGNEGPNPFLYCPSCNAWYMIYYIDTATNQYTNGQWFYCVSGQGYKDFNGNSC
jgi:hypothetical protein